VEFETAAQILDHDYNHSGDCWQSIRLILYTDSEQRKPVRRIIGEDVRATREISRFQLHWRILVRRHGRLAEQQPPATADAAPGHKLLQLLISSLLKNPFALQLEVEKLA